MTTWSTSGLHECFICVFFSVVGYATYSMLSFGSPIHTCYASNDVSFIACVLDFWWLFLGMGWIVGFQSKWYCGVLLMSLNGRCFAWNQPPWTFFSLLSNLWCFSFLADLLLFYCHPVKYWQCSKHISI